MILLVQQLQIGGRGHGNVPPTQTRSTDVGQHRPVPGQPHPDYPTQQHPGKRWNSSCVMLVWLVNIYRIGDEINITPCKI